MPHHVLLEVAIVVATAVTWGLLLQRFGQPAIVGYILAGAFLGPTGIGLIQGRESVATLAELGLLLLLFVIGMEMSLRNFRRVLRVALAATALQVVIAVGIMLLVGELFAWPTDRAILVGFAIALSSTAVAFRILEDIGELRSDTGRIAVGVLIGQDLAVVPMLLTVEGMGGEGGLGIDAAVKVAVALGLLAGMIVFLTRRQRVSVPLTGQVGESVELMTLVALAYCFGAALLSGLVGLSPAYGAFLAGLWIGNSNARVPVLGATLPIQGALVMVFFVSVGLLLDFFYIYVHLAEVLVLLLVVTVGKTAMNVGILKLLGEPWPRAFQAGVVMGQVGEFSFVLIAAGLASGVIGDDEHRVFVSVIALSLAISPLWFVTARRLHGLAWSRITSLREVYHGVYGEESRALVRAWGTTLRLGRLGWGECARLAYRLGGRPSKPSDDAAFLGPDDADPKPAPVAELPPREAPRGPDA